MPRTMARLLLVSAMLAGVAGALVPPVAPAARAQESGCAVDVYSRRLAGPGYATGARHLWIVHSLGRERNDNGMHAFRGGPSKPGGSSDSSGGSSGSGDDPENVIVVVDGPWGPGFVDWGGSGEESRRVMEGPDACAKRNCFFAEERRINERRVRYRATGPNSNTVVSTMLRRCDVPRERPGGFHPGWDDPDL